MVGSLLKDRMDRFVLKYVHINYEAKHLYRDDCCFLKTCNGKETILGSVLVLQKQGSYDDPNGEKLDGREKTMGVR